MCAEAEGLVNAYEADESATAADLKADLEALAADGDKQARDALQILITAVESSDTSTLSPGDTQGVVDAQAAYDFGEELFAEACKTAGSSAFQ